MLEIKLLGGYTNFVLLKLFNIISSFVLDAHDKLCSLKLTQILHDIFVGDEGIKPSKQTFITVIAPDFMGKKVMNFMHKCSSSFHNFI